MLAVREVDLCIAIIGTGQKHDAFIWPVRGLWIFIKVFVCARTFQVVYLPCEGSGILVRRLSML